VSHAAAFGNPAGLLCIIEELGNALRAKILGYSKTTGCGFLKAGESGCKPLRSWDFCWCTGFGVNPVAEWPKVGFDNAIFL
jgi:hypothetical protein